MSEMRSSSYGIKAPVPASLCELCREEEEDEKRRRSSSSSKRRRRRRRRSSAETTDMSRGLDVLILLPLLLLRLLLPLPVELKAPCMERTNVAIPKWLSNMRSTGLGMPLLNTSKNARTASFSFLLARSSAVQPLASLTDTWLNPQHQNDPWSVGR
jgi:hypothetical protein